MGVEPALDISESATSLLTGAGVFLTSHIASKLTIVSKFYQIVRVEKCALNTNNTIPTQSIILSDHVVGKMCI